MNKAHTNSTGARLCPQCGEIFVCGFAAGHTADGKPHCWCFDLPAVMAVRADTACLCPACLTKAIAQIEQEERQQ